MSPTYSISIILWGQLYRNMPDYAHTQQIQLSSASFWQIFSSTDRGNLKNLEQERKCNLNGFKTWNHTYHHHFFLRQCHWWFFLNNYKRHHRQSKDLLCAFKSGDRTDVLILFRLHNKLIRGEKKVAAKLISSCMYLSSQTPIPRRGRTQGLGGSRPSPGPWGDIPERRHRQMSHLQTEKFKDFF